MIFRAKYFFLSNFYPTWIDGYPSAEHLYQACKTEDVHEYNEIKHAATPGIAKRLGSRCHIREDWESIKYDVMRQILKKKFSNPEMATMLLDTGTEELIEHNYWHDNYWGSCLCNKCKDKGQNNLGKLLMKQREALR